MLSSINPRKEDKLAHQVIANINQALRQLCD